MLSTPRAGGGSLVAEAQAGPLVRGELPAGLIVRRDFWGRTTNDRRQRTAGGCGLTVQ
jgi:hypothetical protein